MKSATAPLALSAGFRSRRRGVSTDRRPGLAPVDAGPELHSPPFPVRGDDGYTHQVPVHWVEYVPVDRTCDILVCDEAPTAAPTTDTELSPAASRWRSHFTQHGLSPDNAVARRSIFAALIQ